MQLKKRMVTAVAGDANPRSRKYVKYEVLLSIKEARDLVNCDPNALGLLEALLERTKKLKKDVLSSHEE